ncbi:MAG: hypothetical protein WD766_10205 [Gemmatimonadota bacterium]
MTPFETRLIMQATDVLELLEAERAPLRDFENFWKESAIDGVLPRAHAAHRRDHRRRNSRGRLAMGTALMGIGKRERRLNDATLAVARRVGPIEFGKSGEKCEPFDVAKHLRTDRLQAKLGDSGTPVILIHGSGGQAQTWRDNGIAQALAEDTSASSGRTSTASRWAVRSPPI